MMTPEPELATTSSPLYLTDESMLTTVSMQCSIISNFACSASCSGFGEFVSAGGFVLIGSFVTFGVLVTSTSSVACGSGVLFAHDDGIYLQPANAVTIITIVIKMHANAAPNGILIFCFILFALPFIIFCTGLCLIMYYTMDF